MGMVILVSHRTSRLHRRSALLLLVSLVAFGACDDTTSGVIARGPAPAPVPVLAGDHRIAPGELEPQRRVLRFAFAPTRGEKAMREAWGPMMVYLEHVLATPVRMVVTDSYAGLIETVVDDGVELALMPPASYVIAERQRPDLRLAGTMISSGRTSYSAFILVRADDKARDLRDLRGRSIAYVDKNSSSGYLLARAALREAGLDPDLHFSRTVFAGSHVEAIHLLQTHAVDVAATASGMLQVAQDVAADQKLGSLAPLRVLAKTGRVPYDALVVSGRLPSTVFDKIEGAFQRIHVRNPEVRNALKKSSTSGWAPADESRYDQLRKVLLDGYRS